MVNEFRFLSVSSPEELGYIVSRDSMKWYTRNARLGGAAPWAAAYSTGGDGLTQHAGEDVIGKPFFADFLASLALHLASRGIEARHEELEAMARNWPKFRPRDLDRARFFATLRYKPEKYQWFSADECRVSSADSRRHDRRWTEVPSYADGSLKATWMLYYQADEVGHASLLARVAAFEMIRREVFGSSGETAASYFDLEGYPGGKVIETAFRTVNDFVQGWRLGHDGENGAAFVERYFARLREQEEAARA
jgi:hypothetical protein